LAVFVLFPQPLSNSRKRVKYFDIMTTPPTTAPDWRALFNFTVMSAYFYSFMEWIFFVTKPSSLSLLTFFEKLKVLFITGGVIALILVAGLVVFWLPFWMTKKQKLKYLGFIPSAFILSITTLILFDNFTYTVFKFGVISAEGIFRAVYALGFILAFRQMTRFTKRTASTLKKSASILTIGLLTLSTAGIIATYFSNSFSASSDSTNSATHLPNIIIIGGDGLSANYMSMYGYDQETTPFLEELARTSLVVENAFPNASSTTASTTSALTGKEPLEVNVLRYPDILSGNDSFEHLPGILQQQGYQTVEIGVHYYVDAQKLNLLDGFDVVNNRSLNLPILDALRKFLGNSPSVYFIQTVTERADERLLHIFFVQEMQNPLDSVNNQKSRMNDEQRTQQIIAALDNAERPLFVFAHFMDTHGPEFSSQFRVFSSASNNDDNKWDTDRYKDALLSFDSHIKEIYEYLEESGKLDNTILIIYTDHGYGYAVNHRVPIIIHFPENAHAGTRLNNVEVLDIPVTLLDYLDISTPEWMTGISMLSDEPPADREIISIVAGSPSKVAPPFYQIKKVQIVICHKWYELNVQENDWKSGLISRHTSKCDADSLPTDDQVRQRILDYLDEYGFDISSLQ